jgi:hypothetical protein
MEATAMLRFSRLGIPILAIAAGAFVEFGRPVHGAVTREQVERAIREGVRGLGALQKDDGSWSDVDAPQAPTGSTSLATLALLTAGERPDSPRVARALTLLRNARPEQLNSTYAVALHAMVFATAGLERDAVLLASDADWLIKAQIKPGETRGVSGMWTYSVGPGRGDQSNSQYALLGLHAASEAGVPVPAQVWAQARLAWQKSQRPDGSWSYIPFLPREPATGSMTCAGITSLVITGIKRFQGQERLDGNQIIDCGQGAVNAELQRALDWMGARFQIRQNIGLGNVWRYYYLYGLERAGRLTGQRFFGEHDWYREGADALVAEQDKVTGLWRGVGAEQSPQVATSFALLFLAKGRAPVLVNKLRHGPRGDWNRDVDDVRNLVDFVSRDWKTLLTWQVVEPNSATVEDMLQAPVAFLNGHDAPLFSEAGKKCLRDYIEQGGFLVADACCSRPEFDQGFRDLMKELFPEPEHQLHPLPEEHAVWRARYPLSPDVHPLWGIEHGCRTVIIYTPEDLSCYWNQSENHRDNALVLKAQKVGQNIIDYATGREMPADKLAVREVRDFKVDAPRRGALHIAKLRHAGDWNVAPLAVPSLAASLRDRVGFDVVISHKELLPRDPNLVNFPLLYMHGRAAFSFAREDLDALRRHLDPGGGTLVADAACGSPAFDTSFRKFVAELFPRSALVAIPRDDDIYSEGLGYNLAESQYTKAAGGARDYPALEGVKIDGHWAIIYSRYDIGCALERPQSLDCKGYSHESAQRIATNIANYSTRP